MKQRTSSKTSTNESATNPEKADAVLNMRLHADRVLDAPTLSARVVLARAAERRRRNVADGVLLFRPLSLRLTPARAAFALVVAAVINVISLQLYFGETTERSGPRLSTPPALSAADVVREYDLSSDSYSLFRYSSNGSK